MTVSISISLDKVSTLSTLDKSAMWLGLASKYCTSDKQVFLKEAKLAKKAGGFEKCISICKFDILYHVADLVTDEDMSVWVQLLKK
jgi:hypothetical protein